VAEPILLDTGPVGLLCHSGHGQPEVAAIRRWLRDRLRAGSTVCLPEIADYEVRRELLRRGDAESAQRLDQLGRDLRFLRVTSATWRRAAAMWAEVRQQGAPGAADAALDGDLLLAALAEREGGVVATDNIRHFARFVDAKPWREIG
jgi:predicted nucleic acid-binding protein